MMFQDKELAMKATEKEKYLLRLDPELLDWIKLEAKDNHRAIIGQITMMLEMAREEIESEHA